MTDQKRTIGIVRVSGPAQVERYGPETQKDDIVARAEELGYELIDTWVYQESATKSDKRPQFEEMLQRLVGMGNSGEIEAVIFGRPDRLGRDGEMAFFYYMHLLEQTGRMQVRFAQDDADSGDPYRNFKLFMEAFKATRDAETILRNTSGGRRKRASKGRLPTGSIPWPYDYDTIKAEGEKASGIPSINVARAAWVRKWVGWLLDEKVTLREVKRRMDTAGVYPPALQRFINAGMTAEDALQNRQRCSMVWSASTITRILTNRGLLGKFYVSFTDHDEGPEPIIDDPDLAVLSIQEYDAVQRLLAENKALSARNTKRDYTPLQGLVWCHCGRKAGAYYNKGKYSYFRCNVCRDRDTNAVTLWELAKAQFSEVVSDPENILPSLLDVTTEVDKEDLETRRAGIEIELKQLDTSLDNVIKILEPLLTDYGSDKVEAQVELIKSRRGELIHDRDEIDQALKREYETRLTPERIEAICERLAGVLDTSNDDEWRSLLREFDAKVILQKDPPNVMRVVLDALPSESAVLLPT